MFVVTDSTVGFAYVFSQIILPLWPEIVPFFLPFGSRPHPSGRPQVAYAAARSLTGAVVNILPVTPSLKAFSTGPPLSSEVAGAFHEVTHVRHFCSVHPFFLPALKFGPLPPIFVFFLLPAGCSPPPQWALVFGPPKLITPRCFFLHASRQVAHPQSFHSYLSAAFLFPFFVVIAHGQTVGTLSIPLEFSFSFSKLRPTGSPLSWVLPASGLSLPGPLRTNCVKTRIFPPQL